MIGVQGVSKFLGKKELFQDVSFHISAGERIGLVGPNGAGKTTLFRILLGETEPDSGNVMKSKYVSLGHLPQQWVPAEDKSVLAHAMDVHEQTDTLRTELNQIQQRLNRGVDSKEAEALALRQTQLIEQLEHQGGYSLESKAQKILAGLGFRQDQLHLPVSALSGGWVMRLELARLLLAEPDLLLLDEPTNHLDLSSLLWLENYLLSTRSAVLIIAHDRIFLNKVVQRILELEQGRLHEYTGNYDSFIVEKAQRQEIQAASYRNQQNRIQQMERFVERNRYRKSSANRAQSRLKALEKIERIETVAEQKTIHFDFPEPPRSGRRVIELVNAHKAYGRSVVYSGIDLVVERGDRVAFVGENGAGKSTLLKMLAGVEPIDAGELRVGSQTFIGYYAQHQWEQLHSDWTALEEASSIAGDMPVSRLRGLLGAFLFQGEEVMKRVSVLSGGEKARLTLCKLLLQRPNVLLLDEPTNHLDIPSREVLEKALVDFPGTIAFISHDRHFINAIATKILLVDSGRLQLFPGNFDDFQAIWKSRLDGEASRALDEHKRVREEKTAQTPHSQKRLEAEWRNELYRLKKPLQERVSEVEKALESVHEQLDRLNGLLADPNTYQDGSRVQALQIDYQQCQKRIRELSEEWEEKSLVLEELETNFWKDKERALDDAESKRRSA